MVKLVSLQSSLSRFQRCDWGLGIWRRASEPQSPIPNTMLGNARCRYSSTLVEIFWQRYRSRTTTHFTAGIDDDRSAYGSGSAANDAMVRPARVLLIQRDPVLAARLTAFLQEEGYRVVHAADGVGTLTLVSHTQPDLIILDVDLPG